MFDEKGNFFRKKLVLFLVVLSSSGIFVFWLLAVDFKIQGVELPKSRSNFEKVLESGKALKEARGGVERAKEEFIPKDIGSEIINEQEITENQEKSGFVVGLSNIVFKEEETWIYLSLENQNEERVLLRNSSESQIRIIQNEEDFFEVPKDRLIDYPLPDIILGQEKLTGVVHFPGLDPEKPFTLFIPGVKIEGQQEHFNFLFKINQ